MEFLRTPNQDCVVLFTLVDTLTRPAIKVGATGITTACIRYTSTTESTITGLTVTENVNFPGIYKLTIPAASMIANSALIVTVNADGCDQFTMSITTDNRSVEAVETATTGLRTLITDIDPNLMGTGEYDYAYDLLIPFRRLIRAAIFQYRIVMDTANIATQHRMAYMSFINQLTELSKIFDATPTTSVDPTFTIPMSPTLLLSALSAVTIQSYMNSDSGNLDALSTSTADYHVYMSKIASAAVVMNVDPVWYTTWGKQR